MADATPVLALPYPEGADPADVPGRIQDLAERTEEILVPAGLAAGQGLVWNGSAWEAADLMAAPSAGYSQRGTTHNFSSGFTSAVQPSATRPTLVVATLAFAGIEGGEGVIIKALSDATTTPVVEVGEARDYRDTADTEEHYLRVPISFIVPAAFYYRFGLTGSPDTSGEGTPGAYVYRLRELTL